MTRYKELIRALPLLARPAWLCMMCIAAFVLTVSAQQPQTPGRTRFDVTDYKIEVELRPAEHILRAVGDVTFTPLDETRSVVFELNGSLKVDSIERNGKPLAISFRMRSAWTRWGRWCAWIWEK
ncbi:MAG: hypothetical protein WKF84_02145 [Pyrinomonadaceae bacterium]